MRATNKREKKSPNEYIFMKKKKGLNFSTRSHLHVGKTILRYEKNEQTTEKNGQMDINEYE